MTDILEAFGECVAAVDHSHVARMKALAVDPITFWLGGGWGIGKIETQSRRRFQFNDDGAPACIVPVCLNYDFDGFLETVTDLIAFRTDRPAQWWSLLNSEPVLNPSAIERARPCLGSDEVLNVFEHPLDWLRNDRQGVVVLDWSANLFFHLGGVQRICAANQTLARRLERALTLPAWPSPEIRFEDARHAA